MKWISCERFRSGNGPQPARALASFLAVGGLVFCAWTLGWAQADVGTLTGRVSDPSGAVVPNASVEAKSIATSYVRTTRSNAEGVYTIPSLPIGAYTVSAAAQGFQTVAVTMQVTLNGTTGLDLRLQVGTTSQTVTVTGSTSLATLQTESHEVSQTFVPEQLTQLPVNGRNVLNVAVLGPGAQPGSDVNTAGGGAAEFFNMTPNTVFLSGMSNVHTTFLMDGVSNLDLLTQAANILPSVESVQEANTETNGSSSRFGQPSTINMVTKSGSNSFHGTAYDFFQNDALDAENYFATSVPKQRYNLFGANFGGPVLKDKLFFFFDYTGLRSDIGAVNATRVPTVDERNGIFDAPGDLTIYDPLTYNSSTGASTAFMNNTIPGYRFDGVASKFLPYFPLPNVPLANNINYVTNLANTTNNDEYLGRVDWIISDKDHLYGSVLRNNTPTLQPSIALGNLFGTDYQQKGTNVSVEDTYVFSPHLVNTARFGFNRMVHFEDIQGAGAQDYVTSFGLKNLNPVQSQWAPPNVNAFGYSPAPGNPYAPDGGIQNRFQYADELSYTLGKHSIYVGADVYRTRFDGGWTVYQNGLYLYDGSFTAQYVNGVINPNNQGNSFADFLLGYGFLDFGATGVTYGAFRSYNMSTYVQDDWKASRTLTLNLGLRYDLQQPPFDKNGRSAVFDFATSTPIRGSYHTNYGDIGPRIGFSWAARPSTVVRGGYGIYYAPNIYNWLQAQLLYQPNWISQTLFFGITNPTLVENAFSATPSTQGLSPYTLSERMPDTSAQQWNLGIQQSLGRQVMASITYEGNIGRHVQILEDGNQPYPVGPIPYNIRPYANIGSGAVQLGNFGTSNYNGLLASISGNPTPGLTLLASYTYSKAMDQIDGDDNYIENAYQHNLTYGLSGWDRTHNFVLSSVYELPIGPGKRVLSSDNIVDSIVGGWQLGGIYHLASGQPTSVAANNDADTSGIAEFFANKVCNPKTSRVGLQWFSPGCFVQPTPGTYGVGGRDGVRNPRNNILDLSLVKNFHIYESHQLQFRAEAFNAFNHPVLSLGPQQGVTSPSLGVLSVAAPARILQLALRYSF